jgi:hypothetical protein
MKVLVLGPWSLMFLLCGTGIGVTAVATQDVEVVGVECPKCQRISCVDSDQLFTKCEHAGCQDVFHCSYWRRVEHLRKIKR